METLAPKTSARQQQLVHQYITELDKYVAALKAGETNEVMEIREFAAKLFVHPVHLSNTVKEVTGKSTCDLFEERLVAVSKDLLANTHMPIGNIARQLTYDPSNFTKFFRHFTGITPKQYRTEMRKS